ncbi:sugar transferase [Pseudoalteromonas sp. DL2-H2.2]|uniref:sugar transferase n=1 Tax=Pseudoalteromonas sp. DL2-H2.2 TaxID=2908889 RepID=UPI001F2623AF|nr:sugar transferase [Pseudoalteromonas sp. DL2-H2.2]MCF2908848.1 sugar transferase [Pseudoalteromonas sp. DL2-H2.2]
MLKRTFDLVLTLLALFILAPVLIVVAILIRVKLGAPILFTQDRPGLNNKVFKMYKFRSMTNECDASGNLLPDSIRLTKFGSFLRSSSLDELPGLWNILIGDMSLVGPRPLLVEYLDFYTEKERMRHNVRPGLTGLAQVSGRNNLAWDERLKIDIEYVENQSFLLDLKILYLTFLKVIKKEDVVVVPSSKFGKLSDERSKSKNV